MFSQAIKCLNPKKNASRFGRKVEKQEKLVNAYLQGLYKFEISLIFALFPNLLNQTFSQNKSEESLMARRFCYCVLLKSTP